MVYVVDLLDFKNIELYYDQLRLKHAYNIQFTKREIDIIACILNGRTSHKEIASLLFITPKTIETNKSNINRKIRNATHKSIRDFLEESPNYNKVKSHYKFLLNQYNFEYALSKINHLIKKKGSIDKQICFIHVNKYNICCRKIQKLIGHLKASGLPIVNQNLSEFKEQKDDVKYKHLIFTFSDSCIQERDDLIFTSIKNLILRKNKITFLLFEDNMNNSLTLLETLKIERDHKNIFIFHEDYYISFFKFLDLTCVDIIDSQIKELVASFQEKYKNSSMLFNVSDEENISKIDGISKHANPIRWFSNNKNIKIFFFICLIITVLLAAIITNNKPQNYVNNQSPVYANTSSSISPWNAPYMPVYFVERKKLKNIILSVLDGKIKDHPRVIGIYGLEGVGKTYLALDMIYHTPKNYSFKGWFSAQDEDKLKADFFKLGNELNLFRDNITEEHKISIVKNWMNTQENLLLIFDNVANIDIVERYLPQTGNIIITSRNNKIPNAIEIDVMEEEEAVTLLQNLISISKCDDKCSTLVKRVDYLPLAVSQASSYIAQNNITIDKYIELYDDAQDVLLASNFMPIAEKHMPVYITWNLTLEEIASKDTTGKALELLYLISFCHFVDIPKVLLLDYLYGSVNNRTEIALNTIIAFLRQYSLIKITRDTVAIHQLVQNCIRSNLTLEQKKIILKKSIESIKKIYPLNNKKSTDYETLSALLPQMEAICSYAKNYLNQEHIVELIKYISNTYYKLGDYDKAKELLEENLAIQKAYYKNQKHIEISFTIKRLGAVYVELGNYSKAKELLEEALAIQENCYGNRMHIEVVSTLKWLAIATYKQGDYTKAKILLEEALAIQERYYGKQKHISTTFIARRLGKVYLWLGEYEKAKELLKETLTIQEEYYGTHNHIEISFTIKRLGSAYLWLGKYIKAKELLEEALAIQERYYGRRNHIEIASTMNWVASAYFRLGNYKAAKTLLEEAFEIQENYYGVRNHIEISFTLRRLGSIYLSFAHYQKAKELLEEALAIQEKYYGHRNHIETLFILKDLGATYFNLGEYVKAKQFFEEALVAQENYYHTKNNIQIAYTLRWLGKIYLSLGKDKKAKELLEEALSIQERNYDLNHPEIANSLAEIAYFEHNVNNNNEYALDLIDRASHILESNTELDPQHSYIKNVKHLKQKILQALEK